jgi:hypothetical protein
MPICSIVQSVLSEWEITCGRAVFRSHYSKWYSAHLSVLFLRALAWLHTKWNIMQLMHVHQKHFETLLNSVMRQMHIIRFLYFIDIRMNLTRHENMAICGKDKFIASYAKCYSLTELTPVELLCSWKVESFSNSMYWINTNSFEIQRLQLCDSTAIWAYINMIWYDVFVNCIGLTPGGSSTLHI